MEINKNNFGSSYLILIRDKNKQYQIFLFDRILELFEKKYFSIYSHFDEHLTLSFAPVAATRGACGITTVLKSSTCHPTNKELQRDNFMGVVVIMLLFELDIRMN